ncbi:signal peptide peptidase SppA [Rhodoligotrophos defluvii]|uniref:signal peptide peptidase SppA n=1 Tax=Rhodoligotrophos defluvii TaxID=2561934 RepID=UPI001EF0AFC3|nr:signal peptide peptidase SppA [Rhodoligotrophos defluvii]
MIDADTLTDRRRLKRRLSFWRLVAVAAVLGAAILAVFAAAGTMDAGKLRDHIARVRVSGVIADTDGYEKLLKNLRESKRVKAVIIEVNSPGGTTAGSELLFKAIRELAAVKPVVTTMGTVAASGGYITAIAADHIIALGNTTTGSIGVILQWPQLTEMLGKLGIEMHEIKSGPLKAEPSPFTPLREDVRRVTQSLVDDSYDWFVGLVAERRGMSMEDVRQIADGRVFTGRQAVAAGLADELGGEDEALRWLRTQRNIDRSLKIENWAVPDSNELGLSGEAARLLMTALGLGDFFNTVQKTLRVERLSLDGLVSIWHPE